MSKIIEQKGACGTIPHKGKIYIGDVWYRSKKNISNDIKLSDTLTATGYQFNLDVCKAEIANPPEYVEVLGDTCNMCSGSLMLIHPAHIKQIELDKSDIEKPPTFSYPKRMKVDSVTIGCDTASFYAGFDKSADECTSIRTGADGYIGEVYTISDDKGKSYVFFFDVDGDYVSIDTIIRTFLLTFEVGEKDS